MMRTAYAVGWMFERDPASAFQRDLDFHAQNARFDNIFAFAWLGASDEITDGVDRLLRQICLVHLGSFLSRRILVPVSGASRELSHAHLGTCFDAESSGSFRRCILVPIWKAHHRHVGRLVGRARAKAFFRMRCQGHTSHVEVMCSFDAYAACKHIHHSINLVRDPSAKPFSQQANAPSSIATYRAVECEPPQTPGCTLCYKMTTTETLSSTPHHSPSPHPHPLPPLSSLPPPPPSPPPSPDPHASPDRTRTAATRTRWCA